ncbi:MAG: SDR family oxidoreductase [Candidatus Zixiibacteriota bacterium]
MADCKPLEGKTAFVSGGTKGIGLATALGLAEQGANVVINYFRSRDAADDAVEKIKKFGVECYAHRANIGKHDQIPPIFEKIKENFGGLDIMVSNAALGLFSSALTINDKAWHLAMNTNAQALLVCAQHAVAMMKNHGRIVALSSLGSQRYIPGYAAVGVSKAAIENIVKYLAIELAPRRITVNCVSGGFIDTNALSSFPNYQDLIDEVVRRTPFDRIGTPEEIADVVVFLCGPKATWLTGQTIIVDGGYSLA